MGRQKEKGQHRKRLENTERKGKTQKKKGRDRKRRVGWSVG